MINQKRKIAVWPKRSVAGEARHASISGTPIVFLSHILVRVLPALSLRCILTPVLLYIANIFVAAVFYPGVLYLLKDSRIAAKWPYLIYFLLMFLVINLVTLSGPQGLYTGMLLKNILKHTPRQRASLNEFFIPLISFCISAAIMKISTKRQEQVLNRADELPK